MSRPWLSLALVPLLFACAPAAQNPALDPVRVDLRPVASAAGTGRETQGQSRASVEGPAVLRDLPGEGALYLGVRTGHLDTFLEQLVTLGGIELSGAPLPALRDRLREVVTGMSIDPARPVLLAIRPADPAQARTSLEALARLDQGAPAAASPKRGGSAAQAVLVRLLVPLVRGTDARAAAQHLVGAIDSGAKVEDCRELPLCQGKDAPLGVLRTPRGMLAFYSSASTLQIDLAIPLFVGAEEAAGLFDLLGRFRSARGGPRSPLCDAFSAGAALSLCVDAVRAGELGATLGYGKVAAVVGTDSLSPQQRRDILSQGMRESARNLELAAPTERLLDNGTLTFWPGPRMVASWSIPSKHRKALERVLGDGYCGRGVSLWTGLWPRLAGAFGDPGPEFRDGKAVVRRLQEAGWGGWVVAFARTWPNLLLAMDSRLPEWRLPASLRSCARIAHGRFELESTW